MAQSRALVDLGECPQNGGNNLKYIPVSNIEADKTLQAVGLSNHYVKAVSVILQCKYHVSIPDEEIPQLTVQRLLEIDLHAREPEFKQEFGLPALFTHVPENELLGTADIVVLPTLIKGQTVNDDGRFMDLSKQYLWVVGGVEGHYMRFRTLCARLKLPALVLQPPATQQTETFQDTARRYVQTLKRKTNLRNYNDFYLLGYESGVVTALEMAAILEKEGLKGTVFCVGGYPKDVIEYMRNNLLHLDTEDKKHTALIQHIVSLMCNDPVEFEDMSLMKGSSLQEKLDVSLSGLMKNVKQTTPYVRAVIAAAYARIQQALHHKVVDYSLKSRIVLLVTTSTLKDYSCDIKSLSQGPVATHTIEAPLMYATEHPKCASVVNSYLSTELLEAYSAQNLCDVFAPVEDIFHTDEE